MWHLAFNDYSAQICSEQGQNERTMQGNDPQRASQSQIALDKNVRDLNLVISKKTSPKGASQNSLPTAGTVAGGRASRCTASAGRVCISPARLRAAAAHSQYLEKRLARGRIPAGLREHTSERTNRI